MNYRFIIRLYNIIQFGLNPDCLFSDPKAGPVGLSNRFKLNL